MTTRATLLNKIHRLVDDTPVRKVLQSLSGDGTTTVYKISEDPIVPASETIAINSVNQTRDTDYTIDNENGTITLTNATSSAITGNCQSSYYSHQLKLDTLDEVLTSGWAQEVKLNDYSAVANGRVLQNFESSTGITNGAADTIKFKTGTQGWRITDSGSGVTCQYAPTATLDLRGRDTDKFRFYCYADESSNLSSGIIRFHTTAGSAYYSYTFTSDVQDGWQHIEADRSEFTATGSPDWRSIVRIDFIITGTASGINLTVDQLSLAYSDTVQLLDLPSECWKLLNVYLYSADGTHRKKIRTYNYYENSGQSGVDQIEFLHKLPAGHKIGLRYAKLFSALATDATTTDLPAVGEMAVCYEVASRLVYTKEPRRIRSGDRVGYKGEEGGAREYTHINVGESFAKKAKQLRAAAGIAPIYTGTTPIDNT